MDDLFEMPPQYTPTLEEVESRRTPAGFFHHSDLRRWGVAVPLVKGWEEALLFRARAETRRRKAQ